MQQNVRIECPRCSRPLDKFNGHIGYCSQHKWVSPQGLGYDDEAAAQNLRDEAEAEKSRLEEERKKQQKKQIEEQERHRRAVMKAAAVVVVICVIIAAVVFFVVRPGMNYKKAAELLAAGDYEAALTEFDALRDYKDSAALKVLTEAMVDLQEGRASDAAAKLDQLTGEGQGEIARRLADALRPVVVDWQRKGLTPEALLLLLDKAEIIDPDGELDVNALRLEGHAALLDGSELASYADDVNGDGEAELIVLGADYAATAYRMTAEGNVRIAMDNETAAKCQMAFGNEFKETDVETAVACFAGAYRMDPNDETRAALAAAYRTRATACENAGDMNAALQDARSAMETSGAAEDFDFFYEMNLRACRNGNDAATAIALWDDFAADCVAELTRFAAKDRWQGDAAGLHMAYAAELAARKDAACIDELKAAADMGADVTGAVAEAAARFEPGVTRVRLRMMETELHGEGSEKAQQARAEMEKDILTAIGEWESLGIAPADVPALIVLADRLGVDLSKTDRSAAYEKAALAAAGSVAQSDFVDWNGDGYSELLALDAEGMLVLYGMDETWHATAAVDTKLPGASYVIANETAPVILVRSAAGDELLAVTGTVGKFSVLFRESGLSRYDEQDGVVTFSRKLEGSISRYNDYTYRAIDAQSRPERTGVDWLESDYPKPATAADAIQRYFEARAYDIAKEAALLTAGEGAAFFSGEALAQLPLPEVPVNVGAAVYQKDEGYELYEVTYPSGGQTVRTWIAVEYDDGWKLVGAADSYGPGLNTDDIDDSVELIGLNAETVNTLSSKGSRSTYRVLVPSAGRLGLVWKSGEKAVSRTSHAVSMVQGSLTGDVLFAYELQPSLNVQKSKDMFVSAGVYYVTVEAKIADAAQYSLTISFDPEANVELESNDVPAEATQMSLETGYSGTLSDAKDVDFYMFTLDAAAAVNVTLGLPGSGSKSVSHAYAVYSAADGSRLATVSVPGNAQLAETGNLYLSPGNYLVQVAKGTSFINDVYTLTVTASSNGNMESEGNNTPETANAVPVNEDVHASIGQEGDIDCFAFTLDTDAVVQPRFTFKPTDSSSKTYVLTLLDGSRRELLRTNIGGKESTKVFAPVALTAGTYTVKIENPRFVRQDYTLHLVSMPVEAAEKEPNDTAALAADLAIGAPRTGVLTTAEDVDYYKLTFARQTTVTLDFSFAQSTAKDTVFVLTIEQNGKKVWNTNIKGDSGGLEQQLQFPAGEYYLKIKPSAWLSAVYTVEVR